MLKTLPYLMLSALTLSTVVWAQDDRISNTGTGATTTARAEDVTRGSLKDQAFTVNPEVGVLVFNDAAGTQSRAAYGLGLDANISKFVTGDMTNLYVGLSSGFIFSHLGTSSANFMGSSSSTSVGAAGNAGSNAYIIPANLKVGYNATDNLRISAHGGGNVIYRSFGNSMNLGSSSTVASSVWRLFPNVGADVDFLLAKNVALTLRPDLTLTPGDAVFAGMASISIGVS